MSKSLGNVISPGELLKTYPADAIRQWAAMSGAMAKDRPFSYEDLKFSKSFLTKLWNAARFIETSLSGYKKLERHSKNATHIDRWILKRCNALINSCSEAFENYDYQKAIYALHDFFWHDFCDDYLEYVKHRIYGPDCDEKNGAGYALHAVLEAVILLLAPIAPHITEEVYHEVLKGEGSVHKAAWPGEIPVGEAEGVEAVETVREIIKQVRQQKAAARLAQNAEIEKAIISGKDEEIDLLVKTGLLEEIKKIAKIKEVEFRAADKISVSLL